PMSITKHRKVNMNSPTNVARRFLKNFIFCVFDSIKDLCPFLFCHLKYDGQSCIKKTRTIIRRIRLLVKVNLYLSGMKMMEGVYLLLGTNLGDRAANLNKALLDISSRIGKVREQSSVYETDAWGKTDQSAFLNMVISVDTLLSPLQILE